MENVQEKLKKSSKAMSVIMKIGQVSCIVGFCLAIVLLVWLLTFNSIDPITVLETEHGSLRIAPPVGGVENYTIGALIVFSILIMLLVAVYYFAFRNGYKVFRGIFETGEPFRPEYAGLIRSVAWMMLACAVIRFVGLNIIELMIQTGSDGDLPMGHLICSLMLLFFSRIFQYGTQLQQLSDETL